MNFGEMGQSIRDLLETGGLVMTLVFFLSLAMWLFIWERLLFLWILHPKRRAKAFALWQRYPDKKSWLGKKLRVALISQLMMRLEQRLEIVKALVALCPLIGLLGTISGMIRLFEVIGIWGGQNLRLLVSGISMATLPTMAGMLSALPGLYMGALLERLLRREKAKLYERFTLE